MKRSNERQRSDGSRLSFVVASSELGGDLDVIRFSDIDNHCRDDGLWVIIHGFVYDLQAVIETVSVAYFLECIRDCVGFTLDSRYKHGVRESNFLFSPVKSCRLSKLAMFLLSLTGRHS